MPLTAAALFLTLQLAGAAEPARPDYIPVEVDDDVVDFGWAPPTIYVNRAGVTVYPGQLDDSRTNVSVLARQPSYVPPFAWGDPAWGQLMGCLTAQFAAYDIAVTDVDPGAGEHIELVVGGSPYALGLPGTYAGVAPMTCAGIITNAIVYAFPDAIPTGDVQLLCEIGAQEIAHAFGLDHELLCTDPMSYCTAGVPRTFQAEAAACGESSPRPCACGGAYQSSHQMLLTLIGPNDGDPGDPGDPPPPPPPPPPWPQPQPTPTCATSGADLGALVLIALGLALLPIRLRTGRRDRLSL